MTGSMVRKRGPAFPLAIIGAIAAVAVVVILGLVLRQARQNPSNTDGAYPATCDYREAEDSFVYGGCLEIKSKLGEIAYGNGANVRIVSVRPAEWTPQCSNYPAGVPCSHGPLQGYRVTFDGGGRTWQWLTDHSGRIGTLEQ